VYFTKYNKFTCLILKTNISVLNLTYFLILTDFILIVIRRFRFRF
jgi:hypothetical protein